MVRTKALLLAAGLGTRLKPLTDHTPKCLAPVAGRPILDYWIDALGDAAVLDARLNTHSHPEQVRDYIASVNGRGCLRLAEFYEPELLGSAGTVTANRDLAEGVDEVIIVYADNLSAVDLGAMLAYHRSHPDPVTMLLFHAENPRECGIADLDEENRVVAFVEKPEHPPSDLANAGVYIADAGAYREMADMGGFDMGFEVLPRFVGRMRGFAVEGTHIDIGTPEKYAQARELAGPILGARGYDADGTQPAVFLDRDGTLIEQVHYLSRAEDVRVLPGVAPALRRLRKAGYRCVVTTNQAVIGNGAITEDEFHAINRVMHEQLAAEDAVLDAVYFCSVVRGEGDRTVVEHPDRKPGPGMLLRAADDMSLRISDSWMVGDMVTDILAGKHAGCKGSVLVRTGTGLTEEEHELAGPYHTAEDLAHAAGIILGDGAA